MKTADIKRRKPSSIVCSMNPLLKHLVEVNALANGGKIVAAQTPVKKSVKHGNASDARHPVIADAFASDSFGSKVQQLVWSIDKYDVVAAVCAVILVVGWTAVLLGG